MYTRWSVAEGMDSVEEQHLAWLARSFGRTDYLPLTPADLEALSELRTDGAVETGYRVITLADREALAAAAGR